MSKNTEKMVKLGKAIDILNEAIEKLEEKYCSPQLKLELTGYENIAKDAEIIEREIIFTLETPFGFDLQIGGWVSMDRRYIRNWKKEVNIWFNGILAIPDLDVKFGGGCNGDYTILVTEYDIINKEWSEFYKSTM